MRAPSERESRPLAGAAVSDHGDATTPTVLADALADLAEAMSWYESGIVYGISLGRQQVVDEWRAVRADGGRVARALAAVPSYADRCEMTGDHARAGRQRQILAERGITPAVGA